jgi:hypothetical protein
METLTLTLPPQLITLPTQDELPSDDGVPMETQRHKMQADLLIDALYPWLEQRSDGYVGGNMFVYEAIETNERGWLLSQRLELALVRWQGAKKAQQKADRLAAKLRELGINPEKI